MYEFGKRIGKSPGTLRQWDEAGKLIAKRHPSGHRYYDESDVRMIWGILDTKRRRSFIVVCRVQRVVLNA